MGEDRALINISISYHAVSPRLKEKALQEYSGVAEWSSDSQFCRVTVDYARLQPSEASFSLDLAHQSAETVPSFAMKFGPNLLNATYPEFQYHGEFSMVLAGSCTVPRLQKDQLRARNAPVPDQ